MAGDSSEAAADDAAQWTDTDVAPSSPEALADELRAWGVVQSDAIYRALCAVPRHVFIERFYRHAESGWAEAHNDPDAPERGSLELIYAGGPVVTKLAGSGPTSSASEVALVAHMLDLLDLEPGMRVLEIGAGTGYNAALLAELVGDGALVTSVEIQREVAEGARRGLTRAGQSGVRVVTGDGYAGAPENAPYDRVIVTVSAPEVAPAWVAQLAPGGRALVPLRHAGMDPLVLVEAPAGEILGRVAGHSGFMGALGRMADRSAPDDPGDAPGETDPEPGADARELPPWPDLRPDPDADPLQGWWATPHGGFWFYLGVRDGRTEMLEFPSAYGLVEPGSASRAVVEGDRIVARGNEALLNALTSHHDDWRAAGAPGFLDWRIRFLARRERGGAACSQDEYPIEGAAYLRCYAHGTSPE